MPIIFVQSAEGGAIQMAQTDNVKSRLLDLQSGRSPLVLLGVITGDIEKRKELRKRFVGSHITGNWYHPNQEILEYIDENSYTGSNNVDVKSYINLIF